MSKTQIEKMVDRFLGWKLPDDFAPDCGISFKRESDYDHREFGRHKYEPVGTNLLTADQAKAMIRHMLATPCETADEWVMRCAARYQQRGGMAPKEAVSAAEASLENLDGDISENPEDAADEDMTCWQELYFGPEELEAFYRAAYNAGLEAAAKHMASRGDNLTSSAIRALEKK